MPAPHKTKTVKFLFEAMLSETDDCIIWPFAKKSAGHGELRIRGVSHYAHRLVLQWYSGCSPDDRTYACHDCGVASCVNPKHLRWDNQLENMRDKHRHGTHISGERVNGAKLTEGDVRRIRSLGDRWLHREIAEEFGISRQHVSAILKGFYWAPSHQLATAPGLFETEA